jgi:hypothetical protein
MNLTDLNSADSGRGTRRRLATTSVAVAIMLAASFGVGACSSSKGGAGATGGASSGASAGSVPVGTEATSEVCADLVTQSTALMQPILPILEGAATDPAKLQQGISQIKTAMTAWARLMGDEANKAQDPALAQALRDTAKQIDQATAQINTTSDAASPAMMSLLSAGTNLQAQCPNIAQLGN